MLACSVILEREPSSSFGNLSVRNHVHCCKFQSNETDQPSCLSLGLKRKETNQELNRREGRKYRKSNAALKTGEIHFMAWHIRQQPQCYEGCTMWSCVRTCCSFSTSYCCSGVRFTTCWSNV
ncbi:hypothetical protein F2Q70_00043802 [Brassica cretica]|uniref:Uncharacterized protein n=1 Tax=Brassica cretica TaxID=69181 RepID=A0A3N6SYT8_BRACR|nr:hypothetical protein F2Q70_00043802 [Brassica cretica]KAF2606048.1 hypothetical protein F2Q68_00044820 [Brassica cretica]